MTRMFAIAGALVAAHPVVAEITPDRARPAMHMPGLPAGFERQFVHRYVDANGVRLHYVEGGSANGPLVVLLHGWPQTWYTWRNVMPALAEAGYHVVAVDYRGAGQSGKPAGGYDKASMAGDIRALVQSLGAAKVNLVGRDIGLMVAYAYAAQWPSEVKTLTMLDVPIPATPAWNEAKHKPDPELWHFAFFQQPDLPELLIAGHEFNFIHDREYRPIADEDIRVYADGYASAGGLRAGFQLYRAFPEDERRFAEFEHTKLAMPVLALALAGDKGAGVRSTEITMARGLARDVSGGIAPATGHWLPDKNPEFLVGQLLVFLHEHRQ